MHSIFNVGPSRSWRLEDTMMKWSSIELTVVWDDESPLFHCVNRTESAGVQVGSKRKSFWAYKGREIRKPQSARRAKDVELSYVQCVLKLKMGFPNHGRLTSLTCKYMQVWSSSLCTIERRKHFNVQLVLCSEPVFYVFVMAAS